jgi:serine/threonine protein kinase
MRIHLLNQISQSPSKLRWVKGELIGKGSFGSVYHGLDLETGEFMAVKQVPLIQAKMMKDESAAMRQRQRFIEALRNEIELLTDMENDNVVRYLGFEVTSEHVNVFLEYVSGGSIASMLGEIGSFDEPLIRSLVYQILCGLEYLHERGIIHRDIKGANSEFT